MRERVWETITSLKDFIFRRSQGRANISSEIAGSKQAQAQKFLKLLNTPVGETVPLELAKIKVTVEGRDLIEVDRQGKVVVNEIQPLMATATIAAAIERNLVELPNAPEIEPIPDSLAHAEIGIQSEVLAANDLEETIEAMANAGADLSEDELNSITFDNEPDHPHSSEVLDGSNASSTTDLETNIPLDPKLGADLANIALLHQIATPSDTSSLTLMDENGNETTITQTISSEGDATYDLRSGDYLARGFRQQQLSFTIDSASIPTNLKVNNPNNIPADLQLISAIANQINDPEASNLQLNSDSEPSATAAASELIKTLAELEVREDESTVIAIDDLQLQIDVDSSSETMRIVDPTTLASMQFSKGRGLEDRGLLKSMLDRGVEGGSSLAQKLIAIATQRAQIARQAVAKVAPSVGAAMSENTLKAAAGGAVAAINTVKAAGEKIGNLVGAARETDTGIVRPVVGTIADIQTQEKAELIRPESIFDLLEKELQNVGESEKSHLDLEPPQGFKYVEAPQQQPPTQSLNL
ncbi:hypothetical protein C7B77_24460 [Chamaesiphon polymorphus CCALA 037]|uniref:Uncharacterized protein n=1 Tax=Chamaesiphon polymorphus CCALA 037 TaxID=2107692 RepID=A0A2T1FQ98_9CYAN|nr:hypothetical protein C7B77_24460 [Chamaesiphon polymorphus CCALA 037]